MNSTSTLDISDSAAERVGILMSESDIGLRVYVEGGGCSGFQYGFQLETEQQDDDFVIEQKGITMLIDSLSIQYLMGAEVDYLDDLMGARFLINNPNATTTCGCGSSFSM
ncbi:MAG: iron-sulfur cluster insertion protein ErpA [Acidiferrobacterales bacterium]|nr:iron-sulfur cluster insertion protein ErpA [Acidiferrobacterales bacterium]